MKSEFFRYMIMGFLCILSGSAMADLINPRVMPANPQVGDEVIYFVDAPFPDTAGGFSVIQSGNDFSIFLNAGTRVGGPMNTLVLSYSLGTITDPGTYTVTVSSNGLGLPPPISFVVSPTRVETVPTLSLWAIATLAVVCGIIGIRVLRLRGGAVLLSAPIPRSRDRNSDPVRIEMRDVRSGQCDGNSG